VGAFGGGSSPFLGRPRLRLARSFGARAFLTGRFPGLNLGAVSGDVTHESLLVGLPDQHLMDVSGQLGGGKLGEDARRISIHSVRGPLVPAADLLEDRIRCQAIKEVACRFEVVDHLPYEGARDLRTVFGGAPWHPLELRMNSSMRTISNVATNFLCFSVRLPTCPSSSGKREPQTFPEARQLSEQTYHVGLLVLGCSVSTIILAQGGHVYKNIDTCKPTRTLCRWDFVAGQTILIADS